MCTVLAGLTASSLAGGSASANTFTLGIGASDLVEIRTSQSLAPGLTLTRIVRGVQPTTVDQIPTTNRGPWRINVLSIDPALARGHVRATYGPDLARAEKVTDLVRLSGAVAGINASFSPTQRTCDIPASHGDSGFTAVLCSASRPPLPLKSTCLSTPGRARPP